ncbi:MAG: signal recognition particle-docking protein FtsY [Proteobacteria bacterium]|nr:signal recognition particle-docking protein FtsY [Pseudomonadota bacterium]
MEQKKEKRGFFKRFKDGLSKTHNAIVRRIEEITIGKREISEDLLENIEEILVGADIGITTIQKLMDIIRWKIKRKELNDPEKIRDVIKAEIKSILTRDEKVLHIDTAQRPFIILIVGVNGTGKTTTIAKMAHLFHQQGKSVLLAAADTFRAAAIEQLEIWGKRAGCEVIKHKSGADPSAVVFDALKSAQAKNYDILIVDTAGRLHTKVPLMEEIKKVYRVISKEVSGAPHETLLVLDATTGQNAISQAKIFKKVLNISGIALTKLDGTAKGGVIIAICEELNIPIRFVGIGEKMDDLREFDAEDFVDALFED